jgi:hypothetical protein
VLGAGWTEVVALVAAYVVAVLATPAGISGAVLLLPFQVSVLGTPSPSVTPTNQARLTSILRHLHAAAPDAEIIVVGAYDPNIGAFAFADALFTQLNQAQQAAAATVWARFADPFPSSTPRRPCRRNHRDLRAHLALQPRGRPSLRYRLPGARRRRLGRIRLRELPVTAQAGRHAGRLPPGRRTGQKAASCAPARCRCPVLIASAARVGRLPRGLGALTSHGDPLPDLVGIRSCHDAQVSLGPETGGQDRNDCFRPSQAQARVFGQQIATIASDLPQLGHGRVQVVDLAARAVVTADASDPCSQELVGTAHTDILEHTFVLDSPILSLRFRDEAAAACPLSGSAPCQGSCRCSGHPAAGAESADGGVPQQTKHAPPTSLCP